MKTGLIASCAAVLAGSIQAAPPNIVFIYTDDQAAWTTSIEGNRDIKTPNIDRICGEGARLAHCFAATPVCSPARVSVLTSRYGSEVGITDWINPQKEPDLGLDPSIRTWPQLLAGAGYQTALFGKWHLGTQDRYHPTRFGFQTFMGFRAGGNQPRNPTLEIDGKEQVVEGFLTDILTDHLVRFIRGHRDRPFLACLHHRSPHSPYVPVPDEVWSRFARLDPVLPAYPDLDTQRVRPLMREYLASVADIDRTLGRVLQVLEETGLAENTILVFTSDQGYNVGQHGVLHKGNATWVTRSKRDLKGGVPESQRSNIFDTSLRVPTGIRWPAAIRPGTVIDQTVSGVDWFPTMCAAAGVPLPEKLTLRGRSFLPLLRGERAAWSNDLYAEYSQHHYTKADLRMWRTPEYKLVVDFLNAGKDEFYDLSRDPDEADNLIHSADPKLAKLRSEYLARIVARMKEIGDPLAATAAARSAAGG